ncbi:hypothetical protein BU24DRAFT_390489 [Aaosphaeria arxii CBS 175.79]|uniref:Nucleoporin Pom152 n=1 Tax=Aaosphaeria arxii CBS 175.79 TaxID=1450172 RepID=A0A6A5XZY5_9PLEO|nr:uncharacterized protein BU24DRAFT_390489 [Aaosphaeria arxii CBS 175.79]KAF2018516.1 hypothetical protein BU24DRAFT_390489 [Aaosphaeria arxii CBS 175.79]
MNSTPRGPGGFPATPQTIRSSGVYNTAETTPSRPNARKTLPNVPTATEHVRSGPWLSTDILDAATQRFYVFGFYVAIWAWRLYDFYTLAVDQEESLGLCLKWCFIDMVWMFGLPLLEIPWLEWNNATAFLLFILHAALDVMLMFRVGLPLQAWCVSLLAFLYDSELAISERSVKQGSILHNASLILGKQIINILPEGSAILNPGRESFCLNSSITALEIPILINQTEPVEIELLRIDIDTNQNETITIKRGELKSLLKKARRATKHVDPNEPLLLRHSVKKTGIYLLKKVLDQSKLEVRPRSSNVVVATCPQARVVPTNLNRCRNDLANVALEIEGTPPLSIKYRLTVNGQSRGTSEFQSLQPDDYLSPLSRHTSQALLHSSREDVAWARSQKVTVALKETLASSGTWKYSIEEVQDGFGNFVSYVVHDDEEHVSKHKPFGVYQSFSVHERPRVALDGCNQQKPLRVAKGNVEKLPLKYQSTGKQAIDAPHIIEYLFTPQGSLLPDGTHAPDATLKKETMRSIRERPLISEAGLYTVTSVSTEYCEGEVLEPASCLLQNPPEPVLALQSEDIVDKCAGNPIGLRVDLDLIGTPPFVVKYTQQRNRERPQHKLVKIDSLRGTLELTPDDAGHYTYSFESIRDRIYSERPLSQQLSQDVKPSASAQFIDAHDIKQACIDDSVDFNVRLWGEGPWTLEFELIHNGKRIKDSKVVEDQVHTIKTPRLKSGGEYILSLTSVTDKMNCKEWLTKEEAKVNVRHERPKAYFGHIEGKQDVLALEGRKVNLPLRLTGTGPWKLEYKNLDNERIEKTTVRGANDHIEASAQGAYKLLSVSDSVCPGLIDHKADVFSVSWVPRPKLSIPESASMVFDGIKYVKEAVCEGDEDSFDILLQGSTPYDVTYEQQFKDKVNGKTAALSKKDLKAVGSVASIRAETSKAGFYEYKFVKVADSKYDHSSKHFAPTVLQQTVYSLPSARFDKPGKVYSFCTAREVEGEEVIPVTMEGVPPFYLEVEIKHTGTPKPEISIHKNIPSHRFDVKIDQRKLHLGTSMVTIRKIRDSRGCTRKLQSVSHRVQLSVHDAPTATPLEDRTDFCVGERLSFALGGQVPFTVYYTFENQERKASNAGTTFRRLAELPGTFTITGLRDSASECLAALELTKRIHPIPSVRLSGGQVSQVDIHEGGGTDLEFQFWGTPPFEFTYTRSTNAAKGKKSKVLEIRTEISHERELRIPVQEEGTYEVVSIKDRWCSFARGLDGQGVVGEGNRRGKKLLQ